jgi:Matrixin
VKIPAIFSAVVIVVGLTAIALTVRLKADARLQSGPARWPAGEMILAWIDSTQAPPGAEALVERALKNWTDAAAGRVALKKTAFEDTAKLRIRFIRSETNYGETAPHVDPRTRAIVGADVGIRTEAPGDPLNQRIVIYLTALHELGHALGLGHSDDFGAIMYRFREPGDGERYFMNYRRRLHSAEDIGTPAATGISEEDLRALQMLYDR